MKVLWFADHWPAAVQRRLGLLKNPGPQGWVDALADRLRLEPGFSLVVATTCERSLPPFEEEGVTYYVLHRPTPSSRVARIADDWRHSLQTGTLGEAAALVRRLAPDLVHVHGTEGASGLLAPVVAPTPCVISMQGIIQAYVRLYFAGRSIVDVAETVASRDFVAGRGPVHDYVTLRRRAQREVEIMRGARWFIGRTDWDRAMLASVNPAAAYYHCDEMMRAPFYLAEWRPRGRAHTGVRLYTTSSELMGKGTECLMEAVSILRRWGLSDVRLRVAGVPPGSPLETMYRRAARLNGVEHDVDWLGRLEADRIVDELLAADVFVYPSHVDNSPNSLVEAMAVGVPIVASCVGGVPTLLRDREEGLLVPRGDAAAFAGAIRRVVNHKDEAQRFGAKARLTAHERNDPVRIVARTLSIYNEIHTHAESPHLAG
jgi:glycosyltransferase involved in cell wall biosynthesis